ncbi:MAG: hypothetical protein AABY53_10580 [Bdellovibrionota bacterium]|jgi:hypothetical protein
MNYEQNLKNIEILKDLIWPLDTDYIFFNFKTESEFEIIFFDKKNLDKIEVFLPIKFKAKLPIAHIHENKQGQQLLYYAVNTFIYEYNLTTNNITMSYIRGQFRSCPAQMELEMAALIRKLENM